MPLQPHVAELVDQDPLLQLGPNVWVVVEHTDLNDGHRLVVVDHADYFDFEDFRTGIGAGVRYMLPIGPVRVDGAYNPTARDDEDDWVVHFGIGMAF